MTDDAQLLRRFAANGSEEAFRELVARHIDLVYSAARRMANGDAHLAQDVTQAVFCDLARKATSLSPNVILPGWLYRHTCFTASKSIRTERRRQAREQTAMQLSSLSNEPDASWDHVAPLLEPAMAELEETDRDALILRYFKGQDLRTVGIALNLSEDAAQKRVSRALDKLRTLLQQRGATLTATALAGLLTAKAVSAAPVGIITTVSSAAVTATAAASGVTWAVVTKLLLAGALIVAVVLPLVIQHQTGVQLREENRSLRRQVDGASQLKAENSRLSGLLASRKVSDDLTQAQLSELLRLRSEITRLHRQPAVDKNLSSNYPPHSLVFAPADIYAVLDVYAQITHRSILHYPAIPAYTFTLDASPTNAEEAALIIKNALAEKWFTSVMDGDKFILVVPDVLASATIPHSAEIKTSPSRFPELQGQEEFLGSINFSAVSLDKVMKIYADLTHRKPIPNDQISTDTHVSFRAETPLTKAELIYAFDTILGWQNIKVMPVGDDSIQAIVTTTKK